MTLKSKMLFILIGDDKTGKTTLQKLLIKKLCEISYTKLPTDTDLDITHTKIKRKYKKISFENRSYQEKNNGTIDEYFENHFKDTDIAFVSSHLVLKDIEAMIRNGRQRFFNVFGLFFSNSIANNSNLNSEISKLEWDERFLIENPLADDQNIITEQLDKIAENFVDLIISRTKIS